jgi:5-methylcytosine-specific restriction protein A
VVDAVLARAQYSCEVDSAMIGDRRYEDYHIHHRRPRMAGGTRGTWVNLPSNLLVLCPPCHAYIESHRAEARIAGWLLPGGMRPPEVAVLIENGSRWVYLGDDAQYHDNPSGA